MRLALAVIVALALPCCTWCKLRKSLATYEAPATVTDEQLIEAIKKGQLVPAP